VRVFSRRGDRRETLCAQLTAAHPGVTFHPAADPREAVRGADVLAV
jgi:ornithine cyclodeaminase/alanine dehydrogenase-like protein (mu-crystallin family)